MLRMGLAQEGVPDLGAMSLMGGLAFGRDEAIQA